MLAQAEEQTEAIDAVARHNAGETERSGTVETQLACKAPFRRRRSVKGSGHTACSIGLTQEGKGAKRTRRSDPSRPAAPFSLASDARGAARVCGAQLLRAVSTFSGALFGLALCVVATVRSRTERPSNGSELLVPASYSSLARPRRMSTPTIRLTLHNTTEVERRDGMAVALCHERGWRRRRRR